MPKHIQPRWKGLPDTMREELAEARGKRDWSQAELGRRVGLPQMHISRIETGKVVPRTDTLLELVRVLDRDLLMVPRQMVPAVQALIRDYRNRAAHGTEEVDEGPLYTPDEDEEDRQP